MDLQNLIRRKEAKIIDDEVTNLVENQYERAKRYLKNKEKLEKLANSF